MKKKWTAALCALLLTASCVLGLLGPAAASSRKITYFTVVNDTVLELRDDTMPFLSDSELYVPYTVFDPNVTGIQLGVFASYGNNVAVLYGRKTGALVFDLTQDTAVSSTGTKYTKRAIRHNSTIFVPVDMVVSFFDLKWSILVDRDSRWVVRVKDSTAQIQDRDFLTQGKYVLENRYTAYVNANKPAEPAPVTTPPTTPPPIYTMPPPSFTPPDSDPQPSPTATASQPVPVQSDPPRPTGGDIYVAVRCAPGGDTAALAGALRRQEAHGVFFFPPDELAARDGEVRALAAEGHKIGLLLDGETPEQRQAQWEEGGRLLAHILRAGTDMALAVDGADAPEGGLAWTATADGTAGGRTSAQQLAETLEAAVRPEDTFLLLDDGVQTAGLASRLLNSLVEEGCTFRLTLEPTLAQ